MLMVILFGKKAAKSFIEITSMFSSFGSQIGFYEDLSINGNNLFKLLKICGMIRYQG
jgi:hypothetical protein